MEQHAEQETKSRQRVERRAEQGIRNRQRVERHAEQGIRNRRRAEQHAEQEINKSEDRPGRQRALQKNREQQDTAEARMQALFT